MNQLIIAVLTFFLAVIITRWAFGINQMLNAFKAQIGLLILLAKKNGASTEEVDEVLDKVYPKKK
jgi:hypothetical protein